MFATSKVQLPTSIFPLLKMQIIFFDGVCNLCNGTVQWIIEHDRKAKFKFCSLQSSFAQQTLQTHGIKLNTQDLSTIFLLKNGQLFQKSTAVITVCKDLDGAWSVLYYLIYCPKFIRDFCYRIVARNRYRWFGERESCWLPTPELRARFVND